MEKYLLVGIDGGATHSTAAAVWPDGKVACIARGKGLNFNNDGVEKVRQRLEEMVREITERTDAHVRCVCAGMAALDKPADSNTTSKFTGLLSAEQLDLQSDAYIALMGLTRGEPGMIAICGTGSMLMLADRDGGQHISGGWGYLMEDAGSGYAIARDALLSAIAAYEGTGPETSLIDHALSYFSISDLRALIDIIYSQDFSPDRLAGFARHVLAEADMGDMLSTHIIIKSMEKLAHQAAELFKKAPGAVCTGLYGGIFAHSEIARSAFSIALKRRMPEAEICSPEFTPELGAVIHLMNKYGLLTGEALKNMKDTYERMA